MKEQKILNAAVPKTSKESKEDKVRIGTSLKAKIKSLIEEVSGGE